MTSMTEELRQLELRQWMNVSSDYSKLIV